MFQPCSGWTEGVIGLLSAAPPGAGGVDDQIPVCRIEIAKLTGENALCHPAGRPLRRRSAGTEIRGDQDRPLLGDAEKGLPAVRSEGTRAVLVCP